MDDHLQRKKKSIYLKEYIGELWEKRNKEMVKEDIINEFNIRNGRGLTSPTTSTTTDETRLLMEYIDRANIFHISSRDEKRGKIIKLKKFFKSKRNQPVEVFSKCGTESRCKEGKVSAIGRDFVMLTNLKERVWIPYASVESANIVYGVPSYSNAHQHYLYDNNLRIKLLRQFGETVSQRELIKQQFFEESLETNLEAWKDTFIVVHLDEKLKKTGRITESNDGKLILTKWGNEEHIFIKEIKFIETVRWLSLFKYMFKSYPFHTRKKV